MAVVPVQRPYRSKQDYATPAAFIQAAQRRLGIKAFSFDFAADATNAKAPHWWSETDDSLSKSGDDWARACNHGWGWLNPPFSVIGPWAELSKHCRYGGGSIALLVPAAVGSNWFRDFVDDHALVLMLNGRLAFMPDKPTWLYPKDCILCLFSPHIEPGYEVWNWRKEI
jgi:phage N-6-adenine-methyltransferase